MIPMPAGFIHMLFTAESPESAVLLRQATGRIVWIGRCSLRPMLLGRDRERQLWAALRQSPRAAIPCPVTASKSVSNQAEKE